MQKEDRIIPALVAAALAYFGAHDAWTLMQPWATIAASVLTK